MNNKQLGRVSLYRTGRVSRYRWWYGWSL